LSPSLFALELDLKAQIVYGIRTAHRILVTDQVFFKKIEQRLVKANHPFIDRLFHSIPDIIDLPFENKIADQRRIQHDFDRWHKPTARNSRH
jgi:hypothetical protein